MHTLVEFLCASLLITAELVPDLNPLIRFSKPL
jgi:hypothetical protein